MQKHCIRCRGCLKRWLLGLQYLEGGPAGPIAYYVDVKALFAGWSIYLRRGPTRQSPPVLHLTKGVCLLWDKGTQVKVEVRLTSLVEPNSYSNRHTHKVQQPVTLDFVP